MYERPTLNELLQAVQGYLETQIAPVVKDDGKLYFHTLIALNLLKIAEREVELAGGHQRAEWERLNGLQGVGIAAPTNPSELRIGLARRNQLLAEAIRMGEYDDATPRALLLAHLLAITREQLEVANPRYLQNDAPPDLP
jgi:hypothetical protein